MPSRLQPERLAAAAIRNKKDHEGFIIDIIKPKGRGVRTTLKRQHGDFLLTYPGELISEDEGERREEASDSSFRYFFHFKGKGWCIDSTKEIENGECLGRLVNHGTGKDQNCKMRCIEIDKKPHLCLFAIRDIQEGHELLYDYGIKNLPWENKKKDISSDQMYWIVLTKPDGSDRATFPVDTHYCLVGKSRQCDIIVSKPNVKQIQCLLEKEHNKVLLTDYGGEIAVQSHLENNDNFTVGGRCFKIVFNNGNEMDKHFKNSEDELSEENNHHITMSGDKSDMDNEKDKHLENSEDELSEENNHHITMSGDKSDMDNEKDKHLENSEYELSEENKHITMSGDKSDMDNEKDKHLESSKDELRKENNNHITMSGDESDMNNEKDKHYESNKDEFREENNNHLESSKDELREENNNHINMSNDESDMDNEKDKHLENSKDELREENNNHITMSGDESDIDNEKDKHLENREYELSEEKNHINMSGDESDMDNEKDKHLETRKDELSEENNNHITINGDESGIDNEKDKHLESSKDELSKENNNHITMSNDESDMDNEKDKHLENSKDELREENNHHIAMSGDESDMDNEKDKHLKSSNDKLSEENNNHITMSGDESDIDNEKDKQLETSKDELSEENNSHITMSGDESDMDIEKDKHLENSKDELRDENKYIIMSGDESDMDNEKDKHLENSKEELSEENKYIIMSGDESDMDNEKDKHLENSKEELSEENKYIVMSGDESDMDNEKDKHLENSKDELSEENKYIVMSGDESDMDNEKDKPLENSKDELSEENKYIVMSGDESDMDNEKDKHLENSKDELREENKYHIIMSGDESDMNNEKDKYLENSKDELREENKYRIIMSGDESDMDNEKDKYLENSKDEVREENNYVLTMSGDESDMDNEKDKHLENCFSEIENSEKEDIEVDDPDYKPECENDVDEDSDESDIEEVSSPVKVCANESYQEKTISNSSRVCEKKSKEIKLTIQERGKVKDGCKQIYDKVNYCTFCGKKIHSKITRHLFTHKREQHLMVEIATMEKRSKKRMSKLEILVNEGNFKHNIKVMEERKGTLVVARRDVRTHACSNYIPCIYCKKFLHKYSMWHHRKTCVVLQKQARNEKSPERLKKSLVSQGRSLLNSALNKGSKAPVVKLLNRMRNDQIKNNAENDPLIMRYAALKMESLGKESDQKLNDVHRVSQGTRALSRLVIAAQEDSRQLIKLNNLIKPQNFDLVVKTTLDMSLSEDKPVTSFGKRMGHLLSHVAAIKVGLALRKNDKSMQDEAENFKRLLEGEWNYRVNSSCTKKQNTINRTKVKAIPITGDLKVLRSHINDQIQQNICQLEEKKLPEHWAALAKFTMCRLILFNKRRQAEVKDLTIKDYVNRPDWSQDQTGEFEMALSPADRLLAKRMDMVISAGKSRKNVDAFVLIPPQVKNALEILIKYRETVGIPQSNPYIFARRNSDTPMSGSEELRKIADDCPGLVYPERICSNMLRKYIATVSQIMDMTDKEVEMLAVHLGHDTKTHKENYRLAHSTRELTTVAQLLLTVESGDVNKWKGKSLCDINIEGEETLNSVESEDSPTNLDNEGSPNGSFQKTDKLGVPEKDYNDQDENSITDEEWDTKSEDLEESEVENDELVKKRKAGSQMTTHTKIKRFRWSNEENQIFREYMEPYITAKTMPPGSVIQNAVKQLNRRTVAQTRIRVHNIITGKLKKY